MLILTRKPGESLYIGDNIKVIIVEIKGNQIRVGIDAPADLRIYREEIYLQILEENKKAAETGMVSEGDLEALSRAFPGSQGGEGKPRKPGLGGSLIGNLPRAQTLGTSSATPKDPQVVVRKKRKDNE